MFEEDIYSHIIQHRNPNPSERPDINIEALLPAFETVFTQLQQQEKPNAKKSKNYTELSDGEVRNIIRESFLEILKIESAARNPGKWNIPEGIVDSTSLIVDFSAPGTYYRPRKEDRYKKFDWSWNMDRQRSDIAAALGIHIAGLDTDTDLSAFTRAGILDGTDEELNEKRDLVHKTLYQKKLQFLYLGTKEEAQAIRKVIKTPSSYIPSNLVDVIDEGIDNTVDQVLALKRYLNTYVKTRDNPYGFIPAQSTIILPMGIQAIRALPMLSKHNAIPDSLRVAVFPIATPANGINEYATMETKGRVYYSMTNNAARYPIQYTLLG